MKVLFSYLLSFILLALVLFAPALIAETVYKSIDANGNTTFSDKPSANSQQIEITPIPGYTPAPLPKPAPSANPNLNKQSGVTAYEISIVDPHDEDTFTTDIEDVSIHVAVTPRLQGTDKIQYLLNGKPFGGLTNQLSIGLGRLNRGAYTIQVQVIGPDGHMKGESSAVTFYQRRTSVSTLDSTDEQIDALLK